MSKSSKVCDFIFEFVKYVNKRIKGMQTEKNFNG